MPKFRIVKEEKEGEEDLYIVQKRFFGSWYDVKYFRNMILKSFMSSINGNKVNYILRDGLKNAKKYIEDYNIYYLKPVKKTIVEII